MGRKTRIIIATSLLSLNAFSAVELGPQAKLNREVLVGFRLDDRNLNQSDLKSADLRLASLNSTLLHGADLSGASLEGADLSLVLIDPKTKFVGATFDRYTILPKTWGDSKVDRYKKAIELGMELVMPPMAFYSGKTLSGPNVNEIRRLFKMRELASSDSYEIKADAIATTAGISADVPSANGAPTGKNAGRQTVADDFFVE